MESIRKVTRLRGLCALAFAALGLGSVLLAADAEPAPVRAQAPTAPSSGTITTLRDISYIADGDVRHRLDLYLPKDSKEPVPLIVWIHGGAWQAGSKEGAPPVRQGYVQRGYAVASINYRLTQQAIFPAQIEDCKAAIRWLRANAAKYGIDPKRVGVWGSSAGGHLVAMLGTTGDVTTFDTGENLDQSSSVQAVCDYFGPTDLTVHAKTPGYEAHGKPDSPESKLIGGPVLENRDKAAVASPITYVTKNDPPFLIIHGDHDPVVPIDQSQRLYDRLKSVGVSVQFHTIRGGEHGHPGFNSPEVNAMVLNFFDSHLKGTDAPIIAKTSESLAGAEESPSRPNFEELFKRTDADHDGNVTQAEFPGPPQLFERLDRNSDGNLTIEEFSHPPSDLQKQP